MTAEHHRLCLAHIGEDAALVAVPCVCASPAGSETVVQVVNKSFTGFTEESGGFPEGVCQLIKPVHVNGIPDRHCGVGLVQDNYEAWPVGVDNVRLCSAGVMPDYPLILPTTGHGADMSTNPAGRQPFSAPALRLLSCGRLATALLL